MEADRASCDALARSRVQRMMNGGISDEEVLWDESRLVVVWWKKWTTGEGGISGRSSCKRDPATGLLECP